MNETKKHKPVQAFLTVMDSPYLTPEEGKKLASAAQASRSLPVGKPSSAQSTHTI